ncbi:helix-turn-helix domain-containing protein [Promicromonospora sp. Marseille-Q5078]
MVADAGEDRSPRFMKLEDVVSELGVSPTIVYGLCRSGELPALQIGPKRVWRIERSKFEEYIEAQYAVTRERVERGEL